MARWHSANVLQVASDKKRLWQFKVGGDNPTLGREETKLPTQSLPANLMAKDWQTLYKPRLNVSWLAADKAFLRVLQLPPADTFQETASMIELQLEKVSPLPAAQICWTFELLPKRQGHPQTAIVVIVSRHVVEEVLGRLEKESYAPDRLEVPFIDQLLATKVTDDGVWIYPGAGADEGNCLVAWWYGGTLQNVSLLHLPPAEERGAFITEQISQMAWAGELEGWITSPPRRFLVAAPEVAAVWEPLLRAGSDQPVEVIAPLPDPELAKSTARRAAREPAPASLVPAEFTARYRQQFVDRIWMRSLLAVVLIYMFGVLIYLALVQYVDYQVSGIEQQARNQSVGYTNALRLKDQVRVMQDQLNLQFAALECYKAVAQQIPEGVQLDGLNFQKGKTLSINGTAPKDAMTKMNDFSAALRGVMVDGQPLFKNVTVPQINARGEQIYWNFTAELAKGESE